MSKIHDVVIIGGGPAGAGAALHLLQAGVKPVLVEKETFPRYHIGESLTGECGACLKRLGLQEKLVAERNPIKYGVTVWGANGKNQFWVPVAERTEEGKIQPAWTWQVRRSRFDQLLLDEAVSRGLDRRRGDAKEPIVEDGEVKGLRYVDDSGSLAEIRCRLLIDCSGQNTFLANKGVTSPKVRGKYDKQVAIFSQVEGALRDPGDAADNTLIFYREKHHWAWFIPLDDRSVSVGVVTPGSYFTEQGKSKEQFLRDEMAQLNPQLSWRVENKPFIEESRGASNYSYRVNKFTGKGFICLGDSHRFIDPIFSFGLYFAMKESEFCVPEVLDYLEGHRDGDADPFASYERYVDNGQDVIQTLVDCFWDYPLAFLKLVHSGRTADEMIDMFAGRIYGERIQQSGGLSSMRSLLAMEHAGPSRSAAPIA